MRKMRGSFHLLDQTNERIKNSMEGGKENKRNEKKKGKEKRKKRKEKEKKERKMKEASGLFLNSLAFRRSKLIGPRSKVRSFNEGLHFKK